MMLRPRAQPHEHEQPSGYAEDFVNAVEEDFQCSICHLPLKEPVLTRCGHRFCKECLEEHFRRGDIGQPCNCPTDRVDLDQDQDVFPDKATERKILSFTIKCPSESCGWIGELRSKQDHLVSCPCVLVPCTNENCDVTMQRRILQRHMTTACQWRIIQCEHCSGPHPKCQMKDHYFGTVYQVPITLSKQMWSFNSQGKSKTIRAQDFCEIPDHTTNDCPLSLISCPYEQIGCKRKVQRRDMESHLQSAMKPHLDLACIKLETRIFIWKIKCFSELLRQAKAGEKLSTASAPFYTDRSESYGYKLKVRIDPNGDGLAKNTHLSVYLVIMKGQFDAILPWPFQKKVKFTLIDQQEDPVERENVTLQFIPGNYPECSARPKSKDDNLGHGYLEFISYEKLHSRRYIVDDTLFLQVEVGPSSS